MELKLEQVIVRDEELVVFMPEETIVEGEIIVAPIHALKKLEDFPDIILEKMFHVVNKMSSSLFEILGCQGTNILIQNGEIAGQKSETLFIRIIPRFENDNVNLKWTSKEAPPQELKEIEKKFKDAEEQEQKEKEFEKQKQQIQAKKEPEQIKDEKENYLLKSLRRNP